ncbi:MAG: acetyl-CoA carboxylase carboxyltransferase subunit beta [Desulfomonilia bacterium]|nr:acetyl-CoA carboxylase carboxyltransferase subunit beta [Desulfomonilia bacterium]
MTELLDLAKKDGRWSECPSCSEIIITTKLKENLWVCSHCNHHFRINAKERIALLCDQEGFIGLDLAVPTMNQADVPPEDSIRAGEATIEGQKCILAVMDFTFKGGSMGVYLGNAVVQVFHYAQEMNVPLVFFTASGGVRIQEGIWGLLQMIRTVHARTATEKIPMITVFTDPTTGGVSASFASLADILLAEPGARIGFAGPRVIEATTQVTLPPDFQEARTLLAHGFLDRIVSRHELRSTLSFFLRWF